MKKFLLALGAVLFSLNMSAQNELIFVDGNGNEIANGSTISMNKVEEDPWDENGAMVLLENVSIKNTTSNAITFNMDAEVKTMPSGSFQCCYGMTCQVANSAGTINLKNLKIQAGETNPIINTEWVIAKTEQGTCTVDFKIANGPTITVNFSQSASAGINDINATDIQKSSARYNIAGQRVSTTTKGLVLANGKKYFVK